MPGVFVYAWLLVKVQLSMSASENINEMVLLEFATLFWNVEFLTIFTSLVPKE